MTIQEMAIVSGGVLVSAFPAYIVRYVLFGSPDFTLIVYSILDKATKRDW